MSQILEKPQPKLINGSKYRDGILEFIDVIRTHGHKYQQMKYDFGDVRNVNKVCVLGLYNTIKFGGPFNTPMNEGIYYNVVLRRAAELNDTGWTFNQIADELERGISIIR
jgi:hypothetical protein